MGSDVCHQYDGHLSHRSSATSNGDSAGCVVDALRAVRATCVRVRDADPEIIHMESGGIPLVHARALVVRLL